MIRFEAGNFYGKITGNSETLRPGDFVNFKVLSRLPGGAYRIRMGSDVFSVKSRLLLTPGQVFRGRLSGEGKSLFIRLVQDDFPSPGRVAELPGQEKAEKLIFRALFLSGLPLNRNLQLRVFRLIRNRKEDPAFLSRFAALMQEKGLDPEKSAFDTLVGGLWDEGNSRNNTGGFLGEKKDSENEGPEEKSDALDDFPADFRQLLLDQLLKQWKPGEAFHPLQLFNHIAHKKGHWIILPYALEVLGEENRGWLALKADTPSKKLRSAYIKCFGKWGSWEFAFSPGPDGRLSQVDFRLPGELDDAAKRKISKELMEKLHKMNFIFDDNNREEAVFDGFGKESSPLWEGIEQYI